MNSCGAGLLGCLVAWPLTCWAQSSVAGDTSACTVDDAQPFIWRARLGPPLPPEQDWFLAYSLSPPTRSASPPAAGSLEFHDHLDYVARVRALKALSVVRLWDSRNMSLFLGVDRKGVYGLHLKRADPHEGAVH